MSEGVVGYYIESAKPGTWLGSDRRALTLDGLVNPGDLRRVLGGRHPGDGRYLPAVRPARRRSGWDLMFAAPKSVSLLLAQQPSLAESIAAAHGAAVVDVLSYVEDRLLTVSRVTAPAGQARAQGAIAAAFEHRRNAASEPHLHTHLLLANLGRGPDGVWSAVSGSAWKVSRSMLFSMYQLGLRHQLAVTGLELDWRLRTDGMADLAGVPRAALRAASTQRRAVTAVGRFEARRRASPQPWQEKVAAAGFAPGPARPPRAGQLVAFLPDSRPGDSARLTKVVTDRLGSERSLFGPSEVIQALAASYAGGAPPVDAEAWALRFCAGAIPVTSRGGVPRWTTATAQRADHALARLLDGEHVVVLSSPAGVSNLLGHAATVDSHLMEWQAGGRNVSVSARSPTSSLRWETLTGLPAYRPGGRSDVVVVDQADRRSAPELLSLLADVAGHGATIVLAEGGTLPRLSEPRNRGLYMGDRPGRLLEVATVSEALANPAAASLFRAWADLHRGALRPVLVGLGVDEVRFLNSGARSVKARNNEIGGSSLSIRGRLFQAGDRVVVLNGAGAGQPRGRTGTMTGVDREAGRAAVSWDGDTKLDLLDRSVLAHLGHGYAVTPALATRVNAPLLLLGPPRATPALRHRIVLSATAAPYRSLDRHHSLDLGL